MSAFYKHNIAPYVFQPHAPIPFMELTADQIAESFDDPTHKGHQRDNRAPFSVIQYKKTGDLDNPESEFDLYDYLTDGSTIFSLFRFITELEHITQYNNQFDFYWFYSLFDSHRQNRNDQAKIYTERQYIQVSDMIGQQQRRLRQISTLQTS